MKQTGIIIGLFTSFFVFGINRYEKLTKIVLMVLYRVPLDVIRLT